MLGHPPQRGGHELAKLQFVYLRRSCSCRLGIVYLFSGKNPIILPQNAEITEGNAAKS